MEVLLLLKLVNQVGQVEDQDLLDVLQCQVEQVTHHQLVLHKEIQVDLIQAQQEQIKVVEVEEHVQQVEMHLLEQVVLVEQVVLGEIYLQYLEQLHNLITQQFLLMVQLLQEQEVEQVVVLLEVLEEQEVVEI